MERRAEGDALGRLRPARRLSHRGHPHRVEQRAVHGRLRFGGPATFPRPTSSSTASTIRSAARWAASRIPTSASTTSCSASRSRSARASRRTAASRIPRPAASICGTRRSNRALRSRRSSTARSTSSKYLPSVGLTYRPLEGLALRAAWSQTVARPSFREMGFYVSVEPGTDDLIVGNPQLQLSEVESYDARAEYVWGELRRPRGASAPSTRRSRIRSRASWSGTRSTSSGVERALPHLLQQPERGHALGHRGRGAQEPRLPRARVARVLLARRQLHVHRRRGRPHRGRAGARAAVLRARPARPAQYTALEKSRRLFGQPEWIANADLSFDHPDWGTKATLAFFAISDVLDAAGTAQSRPDGVVTSSRSTATSTGSTRSTWS